MGKNKRNHNNHTQQHAHAQQPTQNASAKRPTLTLQKRNELNSVVATLLENAFKQTNNQKEEWELYLEMQKLLQRVMTLEAPLRRATNGHATPEERLANIEKFYRWAEEHGVKYEGVRIAQFPGYDLGLEATRDIAKDEQLFTIPRKLTLSEENISKEFNMTQFGSMSNLTLAYALLLEALKPDSFWKPYIDLLPEKYPTVLFYTVAEMEQLRGSSSFTTALRQCRSIARQYAFIYNCAQQAPKGKAATAIVTLFNEQYCYELYRWSVSTVMTRENLLPRAVASTPPRNGDPPKTDRIAALIPFWDMANHAGGYLTSYYNVRTHEMESNAQADYKKGDQIFIYYGDRSNADLMVHNGFIDRLNEKDHVIIKLGLSATDALHEKRSQLLQLLNLAKNSELKVLPPPMYISPELLAFVRVFNMNEAQLEHWITSERALDLLHIDCALETSLETTTWQYLQTRLMLLLRVFPTTLEADEAQLAQQQSGALQLSYVHAMILEYRVLEKRILAAALDYAKQRTKA